LRKTFQEFPFDGKRLNPGGKIPVKKNKVLRKKLRRSSAKPAEC
jgi:hypothetical protein